MTQTTAPAPMTAVDFAREEFGPTLADALAFVLTTCCTECGVDTEGTQLRECRGCEAPGCDCVLFEDPHASGVFWCTGCVEACGCGDCTGE